MTDAQSTTGRTALDSAIDAIRELCEPVMPPKRDVEYRSYFLARNPDNQEVVARNAPRRSALYAAIDGYERAYDALAGEFASAGYSDRELLSIDRELGQFRALRSELMTATGESA